jgi:curved DNA-binding protein CbpA
MAAHRRESTVSNPYQVLRLRPEAGQEQIEEAYHRMRRLVSYNGAGAGVTEQGIVTAYAILCDPHRRARIDAALRLRRRGGVDRTGAIDERRTGPSPARAAGREKVGLRNFYTRLMVLMHLL